MNGKELFKLLGDLDENMVEDAWAEHDDEVIIIEQRSPMRFVKIAAAAAAGIAVLAGGFYGYIRLRNSVGYSPAASAVSDDESSEDLSEPEIPETPISSAENPSESNADLSLPSSEESFTESNIKVTDNFINTLNSVIDSAADVEALNSGIKSADADALIAEVRAFEHPDAFEKNTIYTNGELKDGAIVLVEFSDGKRYITSRGERTTEPVPVPMMFSHIVIRASSVKQLKDELDGYNLGLGDRKATNVSLYQDGEAADAGDDSGERIIQNGNPVASDSTLKNGGVVRVEYDGGKSWVCFALNA